MGVDRKKAEKAVEIFRQAQSEKVDAALLRGEWMSGADAALSTFPLSVFEIRWRWLSDKTWRLKTEFLTAYADLGADE